MPGRGSWGTLLNKPSHNATTSSNYPPVIFDWHASGSSVYTLHLHCLGICSLLRPLQPGFLGHPLQMLLSVSVDGLFPSSSWDAGPSQTFLPALVRPPSLGACLPSILLGSMDTLLRAEERG